MQLHSIGWGILFAALGLMNQLLDKPVHASPEAPEPETRDFYVRSLRLLDQARVPYLVGGGYAMAYYTGIVRHTKDLDVFIRPRDLERALHVLSEHGGYRTDRTWPHFLAKALHGDAFIDLIYRSGNGLCEVDDGWFNHATPGEVLGHPVQLCPAEETLWSKAFVQERDRFDGADVYHLILRQGEEFDWRRLGRRFRGHERVLLAHLILFGYVYPCERQRVPGWLLEELEATVRSEAPTPENLCRGTLLSKFMYLTDVQHWGFEDVRLPPRGIMSPQDITHFTAT
jgi:hypothetical protein